MASTKKQPSITEAVKQAIRASELSLSSIAREAGVSQPTLHRFMADKRDIYLETADKLAAYFGLEVKDTGGRQR